MAEYKYGSYLNHDDRPVYDVSRPPGSIVPEGGIYRCIACGYEVGVAKGDALPPRGHHTHATNRLKIEWYLLVVAQPRE